MFRWFRKPKQAMDEEQITVPFRIAETARVSLYTVGSSPQIPEPVRWWIAKWLADYNQYLANYIHYTYGPEAWPIVDRITMDVMPAQNSEKPHGMSWELWEKELNDGGAES